MNVYHFNLSEIQRLTGQS